MFWYGEENEYRIFGEFTYYFSIISGDSRKIAKKKSKKDE